MGVVTRRLPLILGRFEDLLNLHYFLASQAGRIRSGRGLAACADPVRAEELEDWLNRHGVGERGFSDIRNSTKLLPYFIATPSFNLA